MRQRTDGDPGSTYKRTFALCNKETVLVATVSRLEASSNPRPCATDGAADPEFADDRSGDADTSSGDADALLQAVQARLARLAGAAAAPETRAEVRACVDALAELAISLVDARAGHRRLVQDLCATRAALAEARAEIVTIRSNERRARRLALRDALTMLPNRSFFSAWLGQALAPTERAPRPLAVLYLDLDGFKCINDTHGHGVGDELLRIVAFRLARAVRAEDVVSRLGGDEFACALTSLPGRDQLGQLARKLCDSVSAPVKIGPHEVAVRPSIGIAICPADGDTVERLLHNADAAMYHAKRKGSGFAFYDESGAGPAVAAVRAATV
ncbi:MAG TPA: GGDEF domain-containing protein [Burkholderiaceae bacterium]|nr:GGDEF domain-containing protein [Burkholderiaceae bacterium]